MHVPAGLCGDGWHVAGTALTFAVEEPLSPLGCFVVKTVAWRSRRGNRQLIELQGWEFGGDQVQVVPHISKPHCGSDRKLCRVVEAWVEEVALSMHLQVGHKGVPMGDGAPAGPCMEVDPRQAKCGRNKHSGGFSVRTEGFAVQCQLGVK